MPISSAVPPSLVPDHLSRPEHEWLPALCTSAQLDAATRQRVVHRASGLIDSMRAHADAGIAPFLREYGLSTDEGVALLSLAEALLRIPDTHTVDALIHDRIASGNWRAHAGKADSLLVNTATLGLHLGQWLLRADSALSALFARGGTTMLRAALKRAMQFMADQFVMGVDIEHALQRACATHLPWHYSFDMLGEGARTAADAQRYYQRYYAAIEALAAQPDDLKARAGISVKLSALHPRYEPAQYRHCFAPLRDCLRELCMTARNAGIPLTVDAEEAERLDLSRALFEAVALDPALAEWEGLGLAVQAYQKRAPAVIDWLRTLATQRAPLHVRLVKGAYWDSEIKRAQERGLPGYPVFTRKAATDVSYLACARQLLDAPHLRPAFATHNALTVATLLEWSGARRDIEFQRLHGMGEGLYESLLAEGHACRIYAPVGSHEDLLAYLVRRLLENGANTSFVNQLGDTNIADLLADPVTQIQALDFTPHPRIPLPAALYAPLRRNSQGIDLNDAAALHDIDAPLDAALKQTYHAMPLIQGLNNDKVAQPVRDPTDPDRVVGHVAVTALHDIEHAVSVSVRAHTAWSALEVEHRARCLERTAELLEANRATLMALCIREAGKTLSDALAEVREAIDYCYYYAAQARRELQPHALSGPTGERNTLTLVGRGPFVCISPWNFPLAIFLGQISAALVAGCSVLAKPAPQTPLVAFHATQLLHAAGVPTDVLQLLPGDSEVGQALVAHPDIRGVVFTGSTVTARHIAQTLAQRQGPLIPLIAETGGQNAMIVDSSALPEQVVRDVLSSAFQSAGQRCSALRVLYLQEDIAPRVLTMLQGAMDECVLGDPLHLDTDIGPIIDQTAQQRLLIYLHQHVERILHQTPLPTTLPPGYFVPPTLLRMDTPEQIVGEVFGPILHVLTWRGDQLDAVIDAIHRSGYGLTLGIHSRIQSTVEYIRSRARVGNVYVNRSMIGAVVGVQPFGGEGLSGTGPKAGGPHYLHAFTTERVVSVDTTSAGGNATLMSYE